MKFIKIALALTFCFFSCKQVNNENEDSIEQTKRIEEEVKLEDFKIFYQKFLTDEQFQLSRIPFPIEGEIVEEGKEIEKIEKKDWKMINVSIDEVEKNVYQVEIKEEPTEVMHRAYIDGLGVDIVLECVTKYKLIGNKWYLVYFKSIII